MVFRRNTSVCLSRLENILMFVIIWACILSIHYAYHKSGSNVVTETFNIPKLEGNSLAKKADNVKKNSNRNFDEDEDFLQPDLAAKVQKELEESKKEQEKELKKEQQRKKEGEFYSTHSEEEVYRWFEQRSKKDVKVSDKKHPKMPKYLITGDRICADGRPDILFYIHSKLVNEHLRNGIRQTYANPDNFKKLKIRVVFILGRPTSDAEKDKIRKESEKNKDIVQTDFEDNHRNICWKVVTFLQWVVDYCSKPPPVFIVKVDDDFFVNPFMLIEDFISEMWDRQDFVACHYKENSPVVRNEKSKWYISESIYPKKDPDVFPKTCSGYTVIMPGDIIPTLHKFSLDTPIVPVDDAYLFSVLYGKLEDPQYIQMLDGMTLNKETGLEDYKSKKRLQFMSVSSWGDTAENSIALWNGTLSHLTSLGKKLINENRLKPK